MHVHLCLQTIVIVVALASTAATENFAFVVDAKGGLSQFDRNHIKLLRRERHEEDPRVQDSAEGSESTGAEGAGAPLAKMQPAVEEAVSNLAPNMLTLYINLDAREDRKLLIEKELEGFHPVRVPSVRTQPGYLGCLKGHINAMLTCQSLHNDSRLQSKIHGCAVFEDDFEWNGKWRDQSQRRMLNEFVSGMERPWDVVILAGHVTNGSKTDSFRTEPLLRVFSTFGNAGYVVNFDYIDTLLSTWQTAVVELEKSVKYYVDTYTVLPARPDAQYVKYIEPYLADVAWAKLQEKGNWFKFEDTPGIQREGFSDIEGMAEAYRDESGNRI